jgi:hypothetical protein
VVEAGAMRKNISGNGWSRRIAGVWNIEKK